MVVNDIDEIWAADLVDNQSFSKFNNGIKYLLMVIDVFSKYGWIVPLKSKTGVDVANALSKIFDERSDLGERRPTKMWTDKGKEFYNKHVKDLGVPLYSTENEEKSSVVERWNRTMKEKMFKYFSANSTRKYIDILDEMVNNYNNTKHSSIKMTPLENYEKILVETKAMEYDENPNKPKASRSEKWQTIVSKIWEKFKSDTKVKKGNGVLILPSDPNALVKRFTLSVAAWYAGNKGSRNEAVSICDELLRQNRINKEEYKSMIAYIDAKPGFHR